MKYREHEKSLSTVNENSIFYKIRQFFKSLFHTKTIDNSITVETNNAILPDKNKRNKFMEEIKNIEDEETILLKLQKKYRSGEIKEEDLTEEQVNSLCALYDNQIAKLKKSNEIRKQKLLEYRKQINL